MDRRLEARNSWQLVAVHGVNMVESWYIVAPSMTYVFVPHANEPKFAKIQSWPDRLAKTSWPRPRNRPWKPKAKPQPQQEEMMPESKGPGAPDKKRGATVSHQTPMAWLSSSWGLYNFFFRHLCRHFSALAAGQYIYVLYPRREQRIWTARPLTRCSATAIMLRWLSEKKFITNSGNKKWVG